MACGRVGKHVANLIVRPYGDRIAVITCCNNPEFRLIVKNLDAPDKMTAEGFAMDGHSSTASGTFVIERRATGYHVDHSTCFWFWVDFALDEPFHQIAN